MPKSKRRYPPVVNMTEFRVALAKRDMKHWQLAVRLKLSPSSLSNYLCGQYRPPSDFTRRIERALNLPKGALAVKKSVAA